jgi:hypothetical protein
MRLADALNAAAFLVHKNKDPFACSSTRSRDETPHLIRTFNIAREKNEPGGARRGEKRRFGRAEIRAR